MRQMLLLLLAGCFCFTPGQAQTITFEPFKLTLINDFTIQAEKGILVVPENHTKPNQNKIELAIVRLKSTSVTPGYPIVYLAGGPGGSGIASLRSPRYAIFKELQKTADVILLDQRGTGQSKPSLVPQSANQIINLALDKSVDDPASIQKMTEGLRESAKELLGKGIDLNAYNTVENAEDLEDLRKALGVAKISLYGYSYGTHLGLAYLKKYDKSVHRCVFGGLNGLDQRYRYPSDADTIIQRIDRLIAQNPKLRKQIPDFPKLVGDVLQHLEKQPITVEIEIQNQKLPVTIFKADVQVTCILNMGETSFIREMPQLFYQMAKGNFQRMGELCYQSIKRRNAGTMMTFTMHAASGVSPGKKEKIKAQVNQSVFNNAINYPFMALDMHDIAGVQDLGEGFRKNVRTDVPALFLSADLDGRTSISDAEAVLTGFTNAAHVICKNISHDFYIPQSLSLIGDFLKGKAPQMREITAPTFDFYGVEEAQIRNELYQSLLQGAAKFTLDFEAVLHSDKSISSSFAVPLAYRLIREKKFDDAVAVMEASVKAFPEQPVNHTVLGDAYIAAGKKKEALISYQYALALNPFNLSALRFTSEAK